MMMSVEKAMYVAQASLWALIDQLDALQAASPCARRAQLVDDLLGAQVIVAEALACAIRAEEDAVASGSN